MLAQVLGSTIRIGSGDAIEQLLVRADQHFAEVDIGEIPVEQQDMNLRTQIGPCIFQSAMVGRIVNQVMKIEIEFGCFLFGNALLERTAHLVDAGRCIAAMVCGSAASAARRMASSSMASRRV